MAQLRLVVRIPAVVAAALAVSCAMPPPSPLGEPGPRAFDRARIQKGAQLAAIGNCVSCHTAKGGRAFAGGYALKTPFGTVHGSNITPDPETGIGRWSEADFTRALREGVSPEGHHYYPAFPYDYFTRLTDDDVGSLYAFVMTREPVRNTPPANTMIVPRFAVAAWKQRYFDRSPFKPDPARSARWNRGAYLAQSLAHCSACHTPRNALGAEERARFMSGGEADGWHAPALNEHSSSPVAWNEESLTAYLLTGLVDAHAITAGPMEGVIDNLSRAPRDDVAAIATYVASLEVRAKDTLARQSEAALRAAAKPASRGAGRGAAVYAGACGDCHDRGREAEGGALQLPLAIALSLPTPANLIHVVREGIAPKPHEARPWMPEFAGALTDGEVVDLVVYLRALSGKPPWTDVPAEVRKISQGESQ
ncbi:MAG TPA: cytochrome c [Usitatibacter sp.]